MKRYSIALLVMAALVSCREPKPTPTSENSVELAVPVIEANNNAGQYVTIISNETWNATIEYNDTQTGWASLEITSGDSDALVKLSHTRNVKTTERSLDVVVTFAGGEVVRATLTQLAGSDEGGETVDNDVNLSLNQVSAKAGSVSATITSEMSWKASLIYEGASGWATLMQDEGYGDAIISINYTQNTSTSGRAVILSVLFDNNETITDRLAQSGAGENVISLTTDEVAYNFTSSVAVNITSEVSWTATLEYGPGASGWASLSKAGGSGSDIINLTVTANAVQQARTVTVKVNFTGGDTKSATLTQLAAPTVEPPQPPTVPKWTELPEVVLPNDNYYFVTHYVTSGSKQIRNYTMLYDASTYMAYWIAYPMSGTYTGSAGRNEDWAFDPIIPQNKQVNLASSYGSNAPSDWGIYSRGHQVASGDRQATTAMNKQTFYYTNMTPQAQQFNGVIWANLEGKLQTMAKSNGSDTLWVVTGAIIRTVGGSEPIEYITKDGKQVPIPNYYYKVVIKRSGSTYTGCGFWFTHRQGSYSGSPTTVKIVNTKTIREIETLTGYNFFCNLSQADQDAAETAITYSVWGLTN